MARKRTIDPDIWEDEAVNDLSLPANLFYIGLISHADDNGRLEWRPKQLRLKIFPGREEATLDAVTVWMGEIEATGLILVYEVNGHRYGWHPNWYRHQYVNKSQPSKIPPHPEDHGHVPKRGSTKDKFEEEITTLAIPGNGTVAERFNTDTEPAPTVPPPLPPRPVPLVSVSLSLSDSEIYPETSSPSTAAMPLLEGLDEKPTRKGTPKRSRREPTPADLAAYAILSAAVTLVFEHSPPMLTRSQWKSENRRGADSLVDAGATPDDVRHLLLVAYTHPKAKSYYGGLNRLSKLAEAWPRLLSIESTPALQAVAGGHTGGRKRFEYERPYQE